MDYLKAKYNYEKKYIHLSNHNLIYIIKFSKVIEHTLLKTKRSIK